MTNVPYVLLSRQAALARELDNIANNIANANTTGFRRDAAIFTEYVNAIKGEPSISQTRIGARFLDSAQGEMIASGGKLDLAVEGDGFFGVITPAGLRLTRAGAFLLNAEGVIVTKKGFPVSGDGGSPISIPPGASEISISADGNVAADGNIVGRIALLSAPNTALARDGNDLLLSNEEPAPLDTGRVRQGYLEASNVNPVIEISRLIEVQRAFELEQQIVNDDARRVQQAIEVLGGAVR